MEEQGKETSSPLKNSVKHSQKAFFPSVLGFFLTFPFALNPSHIHRNRQSSKLQKDEVGEETDL